MTITMYDMHQIKQYVGKSVRGAVLGLTGLAAVACGGSINEKDGGIKFQVPNGKICTYDANIEVVNRNRQLDEPDLEFKVGLQRETCTTADAPDTIEVYMEAKPIGASDGPEKTYKLKPGDVTSVELENGIFASGKGCSSGRAKSWYNNWLLERVWRINGRCTSAEEKAAQDAALAAVGKIYVNRDSVAQK